MYIDVLFEEKESLREKITQAMEDLKDWFNEKMEKVKDFFSSLKERFTSSKRIIKDDSTPILKDIVVDDKVVFKEGTPTHKVWSKVSQTMLTIKRETERVIRECKTGMRNIMRHDKEAAMNSKSSVIKGFKRLTVMGSIIVAGIGAILICQRRNKSKEDGYDSEYDDLHLTGSKRNINMLSTSKRDLPMISTNRDSMKLLTVSEIKEDKVKEVKKTIEKKVKSTKKSKAKSKKVDEVKEIVKAKTKESKTVRTRKPKKSVLKNNPLGTISNNESDPNTIRTKIKGLNNSVNRLEKQYKRIEDDLKKDSAEIRSKYPKDEAEKLIDELRRSVKTRLMSCADKIELNYSEIDRLEKLLRDIERGEYMNNLDNLLEDHLSIKAKINLAMNELKQWFYDKMDNTKDFFRVLKDKFVGVKAKIFKIVGIDGSNISVNVRYGDKVLYKKGTRTSDLMSDIDKILNDLKVETDNIVKDCKEGIKNITRNEKEKAIDIKYTVSERIKKAVFLGSVMVSGISAILFTQSRKISADRERQYQDVIRRDRSAFKKRENELKDEIESLSKIISGMNNETGSDNLPIVISN